MYRHLSLSPQFSSSKIKCGIENKSLLSAASAITFQSQVVHGLNPSTLHIL